jgi:hypothetical protein
MTSIKSISGKWALYGSLDSEIVVCGHSHAAAILFAQLNPASGTPRLEVSVCYSSDLKQGPPADQEYWDFVSGIVQDKKLSIVWNENQHNANFLFQTNPQFTLSGVTESEQNLMPIPKAMMREFFKPFFEELSSIVPMMDSARSVTLVSGPAPKPLIHIKTRFKDEPFFTAIAASLNIDIDSLKLTSDSLRLELWKLVSEMLASYAHSLDAYFLDVPIESLDSSGMLLEKYWAPDTTHANEAYGSLLMEKIIQASRNVKK